MVLVLDDTGKITFQHYLNYGGNFVEINLASTTLTTAACYGKELDAVLDTSYRPEIQNVTIVVSDASHSSTENLPTDWPVRDEMYNFKSDPRSVGATVILTVDESSYTGVDASLNDGTRRFNQGEPHPIGKNKMYDQRQGSSANYPSLAWYQEHGAGVENGGTAGRSFYTSLGRLNETWEDELFMNHILSDIQWTL
ncbi:ThuA-like domain-containing protein [Armillaria fumosa]|nr:ThuA-like domain-containing protein [Armillaria fumosa]